MKVTYNWLKDFVDIKITPEALAKKLTLAGLEVTSLEKKDGDFVLEMEITSNRPDCLSVMGIAREVAAITGKKLAGYPVSRLTNSNRQTGKPANRQTINIQDRKDCPLYTAKIIKGVKVGPSPDWLRKRLELVGCRSVNNIVDITNYILFTCGQPLHTFDLDKLVSLSASYPVSRLEINIRRARNEEEIITIDGVKRILNEDVLVISARSNRQTGKPANRQTDKPIAIAGMMGGEETEVREGTKNILLEAAVFNPLIVRRGRQKLGLESESAYRFERGIDLTKVLSASIQAAELIQKIAGGECIFMQSAGLTKVKKTSIILDVTRATKILGIRISYPKIKSILNNLGFKVKPKMKNSFGIEVPAHRQDINLPVDLMEEIARILGYEHVPKTLPKVTPQIALSDTRDLVSLLKDNLVGLGLNEVITYSLINKDLLKGLETEITSLAIEILNPLSKEQEILRPTLIPSLLGCIATNLNQKQNRINIFEIAKVFLHTQGKPQERLVLGISLCGIKPLFSFEQDLSNAQAGFLHLKGILEVIFGRLGIKDYNFKIIDNGSAVDVEVGGEKIGMMARLQGNILERFDIKNKDVFVAELPLDNFLSYANLKKRFSPLPIYPGILRDISLILKEDIKADVILETIKEKGASLLQDVRIVDYYKGKQIPAGFKGLTISCLYRLDERTLTEAEVGPLHSQICAILTERFSAKIRS